MLYCFIGDELDDAHKLLKDELIANGKVTSRSFNMEPFKVLIEMIRNLSYSNISGKVQIAKIHPPGITEFFGVYWPTIDGSVASGKGGVTVAVTNPRPIRQRVIDRLPVWPWWQRSPA